MTIDVGTVAMINIDNIVLSERARKELGDVNLLEKSLEESGLIQPLAVMRTKDKKYLLLAGGRRYSVLKKQGISTIPVRIYTKDLTQLELKRIEYAENFYRKDMEYAEYDKLIAEIHELHQKEYGKPSPGPGGGGHGLKDTAKIFGVDDSYVSKAIKRDKLRREYPDLFKGCKTGKDATKVIENIHKTVQNKEIAEKLAQKKASKSLLHKLSNAYIVGDFFTKVRDIPDRSIQLVEIDPPYGINLKKDKQSMGKNYIESDYNEIKPSEYKDFLTNLFDQCYRVMANDSWLVCWFGPEPWFETIYKLITDAGFKTHRMCGIWVKPIGQTMHPSKRLANCYEMFFYASKGNPTIVNSANNVFYHSPVSPDKKTHPTERPVELMRSIYNIFVHPGSRILIPFLGSGNGLIAAEEIGASAVGFELSSNYKDSFLIKVDNLR